MAHDAVVDDLSEIDSILDSNGVEAGLDMHGGPASHLVTAWF